MAVKPSTEKLLELTRDIVCASCQPGGSTASAGAYKNTPQLLSTIELVFSKLKELSEK